MGTVPLGKGPVIALTITDREDLRGIRKTKKLGVKVLELRIDRFLGLDPDRIQKRIKSLRRLGLPLIATIRSRREGGGRRIPDERRIDLFKRVLPWVQAIDLELSSTRLRKTLVSLAHRKRRRVILSYHNFRTTPPDRTLSRLIQRGQRGGADLVKIAVTPRRKKDLARFLLFTHRNRDKPLISIAMGTLGTPSRVLAPLFGSFLTYGFLTRAQAPGQLPLHRLSQELKAFSGGK